MPGGQILSQSIFVKCPWKGIDSDENSLRKLKVERENSEMIKQC